MTASKSDLLKSLQWALVLIDELKSEGRLEFFGSGLAAYEQAKLDAGFSLDKPAKFNSLNVQKATAKRALALTALELHGKRIG